jgi:hypothetical protein
VLYLLLYFEDFPAPLVICGMTHHIANFLMIEKFPYFELLSTSSIVSFCKCQFCIAKRVRFDVKAEHCSIGRHEFAL